MWQQNILKISTAIGGTKFLVAYPVSIKGFQFLFSFLQTNGS
jgi:hypothetical protein